MRRSFSVPNSSLFLPVSLPLVSSSSLLPIHPFHPPAVHLPERTLSPLTGQIQERQKWFQRIFNCCVSQFVPTPRCWRQLGRLNELSAFAEASGHPLSPCFQSAHPHGWEWVCKGSLSGSVTRIPKYNFIGHVQLALKFAFPDEASHFKFWSAFVSQVPCATKLCGVERFPRRP